MTMILGNQRRGGEDAFAVDIPPATPPTITMFVGDCVGFWSFRHHHLMSSSARKPGLVFGGLRVRRVLRTGKWQRSAGGNVTEHLLDVGTASLPGWLATVPTCNGSTHTPQGIREKHNRRA